MFRAMLQAVETSGEGQATCLGVNHRSSLLTTYVYRVGKRILFLV